MVDIEKINEHGPSALGSVYNRLWHVKDLVDFSTWKTILDVGACEGVEGITFAELFPDARVYSFEPAPANVTRIMNNYQTITDDVKSRINLVPAALSDKTKTITFHAIDEVKASTRAVNYGMGSILEIINPDILPWHHSVQMPVEAQAYTMDDWMQQQNITTVDAVWMDVQGAELMVLKGAEKALENIQVIMTEAGIIPYYFGHTMKADIDAYLFERGFMEIEDSKLNHDQGLEVNTIYINKRFINETSC